MSINELQNPDIQLRLNSIRRVGSIARALGPERTRAELVPLLAELDDDEDEVLQALAHELGGLMDLVGGPAHAAALLVPLEKLAQTEEVAVRDRAVESIIKVVNVVAPEHLESKVVPLVRRLCVGQWFTAKCAACGLLPAVFAKSSAAVQAELLTSFVTLSKDPAPMVRRACTVSLGPLALAAGKDATEKLLLSVFNTLCRDDQGMGKRLSGARVLTCG